MDPSEAPEKERLRKQGFSKDKRPDLLQIVIGLTVTREGILDSRLGVVGKYDGHDRV